MQFVFSKLWQAITLSNKIVHGVERDIKMGKNAQGRKALDIHIFKLLKTERI